MWTIIAGGREITDSKILDAAIEASGWEHDITRVVCGKARGIDTLGENWALEHDIYVEECPADWNKYGKARAGFIRNEDMAEISDALIAVWDGKSKGTKSMIDLAYKHGLEVFVWKI